jgi:hypothetical protein
MSLRPLQAKKTGQGTRAAEAPPDIFNAPVLLTIMHDAVAALDRGAGTQPMPLRPE